MARALAYLSALALSLVFIYAGVVKCVDVGAFYQDMKSFRLFPEEMIVIAVFWVPAIEIVAGIGILLPRIRQGSAFILMALLMLFILILASAWMRGIDVSCGCFGGGDKVASAIDTLMIRDIVLCLMSVFVFGYFRPRQEGRNA